MSTGQNDGKEQSFQADILPLRLVPDHWLLVNSLISPSLTLDDAGPVYAMRATLTMLKNLYYFNDERWKAIRDTVSLGLIKDTKKYGNTSVSMGAAKMMFDRSPSSSKIMGFLNCGTGGIKFQRYDAHDILHVEGELKPKDAASPNAMKVGKYTPKQVVSLEETKRLLERDLNSPDLPWQGQKDVPVCAFVTGLVRQHWEEANAEEKQVLEDAMASLFQPYGIKPLNESYFLTQEEEGRLELKGVQALYANLVRCGLLEAGLQAVGSFGVGRGSCQWMIMGSDGAPDLVGHKAGMANIPALVKVSDTLMGAYSKEEKFDMFLKSLEGVTRPVIALKSGAALLFDDKRYADFKPNLRVALAMPKRTVRIALATDKNRLQSLTWAGSLDRLCAEGAIKLQATNQELELVYRDRAGKLQAVTSDDIKNNEILYLGSLACDFAAAPPKQAIDSATSAPLPSAVSATAIATVTTTVTTTASSTATRTTTTSKNSPAPTTTGTKPTLAKLSVPNAPPKNPLAGTATPSNSSVARKISNAGNKSPPSASGSTEGDIAGGKICKRPWIP